MVLVIVGPTASGKSALAVTLAKKLRGEVISADSRQVYKGLDVATGKITKKEMRGVKHHLLSVADPKKQFSADDFIRLGRRAIAAILKRGKLPIICGGTGFYIDALLGKFSLPQVPPNPTLRKQLGRKSAVQLFAQLKKLDPRRARGIERQNPVRLIRAIEIAKRLGTVPLSPKSNSTMHRTISIGVRLSKSELRRRIRARVASRMRRGMVAEGRRLRDKLGSKRLRTLGLEYRHLADYLDGKIVKEELARRIERDNWRYAKRQMRWFRRDKNIKWISSPHKLPRALVNSIFD